MTEQENNNTPSASPKNAKADFIDVVNYILRTEEVNALNNKKAFEIATEVFNYLDKFEREKVLEGKIPEPQDELNREIVPYVKLLNELFPRVIVKSIGATITLDREKLQSLDKKDSIRIINEMNGGDAADTLCGIVNQYVSDKTPHVEDIMVKGATPLGSALESNKMQQE